MYSDGNTCNVDSDFVSEYPPAFFYAFMKQLCVIVSGCLIINWVNDIVYTKYIDRSTKERGMINYGMEYFIVI